MNNKTETATETSVDVVRGLYEALGKGDVKLPAKVARPTSRVIRAPVGCRTCNR
jgi:hypothetical protein